MSDSEQDSRSVSPERRQSKRIKIATLHKNIVECSVEHLATIDKFLSQQGHSEIDINDFNSALDTAQANVTEMYDELQSMTDINETENAATVNMYQVFCNQIDDTKQKLNKMAKQLEINRELSSGEAELQEAKRAYDEQMEKFNRLMERMKMHQSTPATLQPRSETAYILSAPAQGVQFSNSSQNGANSTSGNQVPRQSHDNQPQGTPHGFDAVSQLAQSLIVTMKSSKRSAPEPAVYDGNPIGFQDWEMDFDAFVESEGLIGKEPLRYLKRYVKDKAKEAISGHFITNTEKAYNDARKELRARFGNQHNVNRALREKLEAWNKIGGKDSPSLRSYADFLLHVLSAMADVPELESLNLSQENERLASKLPDWMIRLWARKVKDTRKATDRYPDFKTFVDFVTDHADVEDEPLMKLSKAGNRQQSDGKPKSTPGSIKTLSTATKDGCKCCQKSNHETSDCFVLGKKSYSEKTEFVAKHRLCYSCLSEGHKSSDCKNRSTCRKCKKRHPTVLHKEPEDWNSTKGATKKDEEKKDNSKLKKSDGTETKQPQQSTEIPNEKLNTHATKSKGGMLSMVLPVYVSSGKGEKKVLTYALLDTQSDACFITRELADQIKPSYAKKEVTVCTMYGETTSSLRQYNDVQLRGYGSDGSTVISPYEQKKIPHERDQIPTSENVDNLEHLTRVRAKLPPLLNVKVGLLLGADCPEALAPLESVTGKQGEPFAIRTMFGWTVCGSSEVNKSMQRTCLYTATNTHSSTIAALQKDFEDQHKEDDTKLSQDDIKFITILDSQTTRAKSGSYVMPLPFRERPILPDNRKQAEKRLQVLTRKLNSDTTLKSEYTSFMDDLICKGHAESVPIEQLKKPGRTWYIPHFSVRHPRKDKLRIVFDCSATYSGMSLNDHLLQGPDHMNSLLGILCRFRREPIAIACDVEQMFYNFIVKAEDRDYLRFLWTEDNQTKEFRMTKHLFGATSSPGVATYGLRKLASDNKRISPKAAAFIQDDFYVDDGLTSTSTPEDAIELIAQARKICAQGNLRLHKFTSNSKEVLSTVPESERSITGVDLFSEQLPEQRTLGLIWSVDSDSFKFSNTMTPKPATRRGLLSAVSQIYDPIGFLAPFTLEGKNLLQRANQSGLDWDQKIDADLESCWNRWTQQLDSLDSITIPRCIKAKSFGEIVRTELHHFCDASFNGYGACSYLRTINQEGKVHCNLLLGKSRVAPSKGATTIPRLELQSAVLAVQLSNTLNKELGISCDSEHFWTDSQIVLGYLNNDIKRFHIFVANRVHKIKMKTKASQWHYVRTQDNPADQASRGATIAELISQRWFKGPNFLWKKEIDEYKTRNNTRYSIPEEDPEVRRVQAKTTKTAAMDQTNLLIELINKSSNWKKLVRVVSLIHKMGKHKSFKVTLASEDLSSGQELLIKAVQQAYLSEELKCLRDSKQVNKQSKVKQLTPFLDEHDQMRVGGRLQQGSSMTDNYKHPILIPKETNLAQLLVRHCHERIHHLGKRSTLSAVREAGFWIVNGTGLAKRELARCVYCAKIRKPPGEQQMATLPEERLKQTPPFTNVGMDVFGPFITKDKRTENKRWGIIFTCLYSRAIHIEMLEDLSTDAFLNALRCLVSIRGPIKVLFSDHGTNFVGAANELKRQLNNVKNSELRDYLFDNTINFKFTSPSASHQGGVWERMIRSTRQVLNGMTGKYKSRIDTPTLRTSFYEAMNIVNSRPLTGVDINDPDEKIITPNHLLTMKNETTSAPPPDDFDDDDLYGRLRWKKAQCFAQEFWLAWRQEYLSYLTKRQKWLKVRRNIAKGDVVILVDQDTPRGTWKTGIVDEVFEGTDKLVRRVMVRLANGNLDSAGRAMTKPATLERPVQKLVVLVRSQ